MLLQWSTRVTVYIKEKLNQTSSKVIVSLYTTILLINSALKRKTPLLLADQLVLVLLFNFYKRLNQEH